MPDVRITALALYPVKSCRALDVAQARVASTGLAVDGARDREWMLVDARGAFVTQREAPRMALIGIAVEDGHLRLHVPGSAPIAPVAGSDVRL